ncbi:alpha/beta hydrolase [Paenibacillus donghaensis]|nr:alpha/beta hydrolase [Paenibacillus donghaensis]
MFDYPVQEQVYATTIGGQEPLRLFIVGGPAELASGREVSEASEVSTASTPSAFSEAGEASPCSPGSMARQGRPAILFFHGAGFTTHKKRPEQFQHHAAHFASLRFVAICVEYRPPSREGLFSPLESLSHAKSAVRWVRSNASVLQVNPDKIALAGASAGGYLSLCCAMVPGFSNATDDLAVSCVPDALVIFNGGVDAEALLPLFPLEAANLATASPLLHVQGGLPPSLFFHGTEDANIPHATIQTFTEHMRLVGNESTISTFAGMGHGFFNYGSHDNVPYQRTLEESEHFLKHHGFL